MVTTSHATGLEKASSLNFTFSNIILTIPTAYPEAKAGANLGILKGGRGALL